MELAVILIGIGVTMNAVAMMVHLVNHRER